MNRTPHIVFASTVVRCDESILLVQEDKPDVRGLWNLPGGGVEAGEEPVGGAVREVFEETGIRVELDGFLGVYCKSGAESRGQTGHGPNWLRFVFTAAAAGESILVAGHDIQAVRWFAPGELERWDPACFENPAFMRWALGALRLGRRYTLEQIGTAP